MILHQLKKFKITTEKCSVKITSSTDFDPNQYCGEIIMNVLLLELLGIFSATGALFEKKSYGIIYTDN